MPIFDKELIDNVRIDESVNRQLPPSPPILGEIDANLGGFELNSSGKDFRGRAFNDFKNFSNIQTNRFRFDSPASLISKKELWDNKRYPMYHPDLDLENIYGLQQSAWSQWGNSAVKFLGTGLGTFAQSFATIPNTIAAIKTGKMDALSGDPDGYESRIDGWLKNMDDKFPNYYTNKQKDNPWLAIIPFAPGSANFWGDKVFRNLGFTAGAISGALVQDAAVGFVTGGFGSVPLIAAQIGKASLYLNKIFAGTNKIDDVFNLAARLGKSEKFGLSTLAMGAAATRLNSGFRYSMSIWGSARTEAAIESRESYRHILETLTNEYKLKNGGNSPTGIDLQEIKNYATDGMNTRFAINMALLSASNAIQFGSLFKSFTHAGGGGVTGALSREIADAGKIGLREGSIDVFEKKTAKSLSGRIWDSVKPTGANILTEGVWEEGGQFATEKGTNDYYTRKYRDLKSPQNLENWNAVNESVKSVANGLAKQFGTQEGIEAMIIGGISAMISGKAMEMYDKKQGKGKDARLNSAINIINQQSLTGTLSGNFDNTLNSLGNIAEMNDAIQSKDVFKYKNLKHELFFGLVNSRIPSGMHDVTIAQLELLKELSKEEFVKTFGVDFNNSNKQTVGEYVDALIDKANSINRVTESISATFTNVFKPVSSPQTPEEIQEYNNYNTFNNWKTDLAYYQSIEYDVDDRIGSIQQRVNKTQPLLGVDLLSSLTNRDGLKDLSASYEQKANASLATITEYSSLLDRQNTKANAKILRTFSEKINLALASGKYDSELLNSLLNFELNNQNSKGEKIVNASEIAELITFSEDLNKLKDIKGKASKIFDIMTTKEEFDKYFKPQDEKEEPAVAAVSAYQFVNKNNVSEDLEVNREYQIERGKRVKIKKINDDRWQVVDGSGTATFYDTKEKAKEAADEINDNIKNINNVKVLALNPDGTVKVEDVNGDIINISVDELKGYERIQTKQEKFLKNKQEIDKEQVEIEIFSGEIGTGNNQKDLTDVPWEDPKKATYKLFSSSKTESEDWADVSKSAPHIKRSREFLNNIRNFKNRGNFKAILVTSKQEESLGIKGMADLSYGENDMSNVNDVNEGFVAQVFVIQEGGKTYFANKDGGKLSEVGQQVDMEQIVFQTMPTTAIEGINNKGESYPLYRTGQQEEAEKYAKAWGNKRAELFAASIDSYTIYDFVVSRGFPFENIVNEKPEKNHVGGILIPENKISNEEGLIQISITGQISHQGELFNFPKGRPVLQYGDVLQFLNNRTFNSKEAENIFAVINAIAEEIKTQSDNNEKISINRAYSTFLQNVLYWKTNGKGSNVIFINTNTMTLSLGGTDFPITALNKAEIIEKLLATFSNTNNKTLVNKFADGFNEFYVNDKGELEEREWTNYQTYLLSSTFPDGSNRSSENIPLTTSVAAPSAQVPNSFKQKYSTLVGLIDVPKTTTPSENSNAPKWVILDGKTRNKTLMKEPFGEIEFTMGKDVSDIEIMETASVLNASKDPTILAKAEAFNAEYGYTDLSPIDAIKYYLMFSIATRMAAGNLVPVGPLKKEEPKQPTPPKADIVGSGVVDTNRDIERKKQEKSDEKYNPKDTKGPSDEYRRIGENGNERMSDAEVQLFKTWAAENVPNIPYEVLEQMVSTHDGKKAWGVFENGVAKFVRGGLRGTEYHEVFEGIWKAFLSSKERQTLLDEFKNKKGTFIDRESGKKIEFSQASDVQAKERIADDFSDFRLGKLPAVSLTEKILKFFRNILEFIKSFVNIPSKKDQLFKAINVGKFKGTMPAFVKNEAAEYRAVEGLTEKETQDFVNDMTMRAHQFIFGEDNKANLFNLNKITTNELFSKIRTLYNKEGKIAALGEKRWKDLVKKTKEAIRATFKITFNEEVLEENKNNKDFFPEPFSVDVKEAAASAIKFGIAGLPETVPTNQENLQILSLPKRKESGVKGLVPVNFNRTFAILLEKLSNTSDLKKIIDKFVSLSETDSNFVRAFKLLGGDLENKTIDYKTFDRNGWRFFVQFIQTFTLQQPEALIQYINGDETWTSPANRFGAIKNIKNQWNENMKSLSKLRKSVIYYNSTDKVYRVDGDRLIKSLPEKPSVDEMIKFLEKIGIIFPKSEYVKLKSQGKQGDQIKKFTEAVNYIRTYLGKETDVLSLRGRTLGISSSTSKLAQLLVDVSLPDRELTYFGIDGKRRQLYANNSYVSLFQNDFNESATLDELLEKRPELHDVFSTNGQILKKGGTFFNKDGERIKELKLSYIQGTDDNGKEKTTSDLSLGERVRQEINQNINGRYHILIPGDSATEGMLNLGNHFKFEDLETAKGWNKIYNIFNGYLKDEVALALEARDSLKNVKGRNKSLRFFEEILNDVNITQIHKMIDSNSPQAEIEEYINANISDINDSINKYISDIANETQNILLNEGVMQPGNENTYTFSTLENEFAKDLKIDKFKLSSKDVGHLFTFLSANSTINNIEFHKILFGDPFQFGKKENILEEVKRIKMFLSQKKLTIDFPEFNTWLNNELNVVDGNILSSTDPGHHLHKSFANTVVLEDPIVVNSFLANSVEGYEGIKESDSGSLIMDGAYREVLWKNGQWTDEGEAFYQWQMAYTRNKLASKGKYKYNSDSLKKHDGKLILLPIPKYTLHVLKPVASGGKNNKQKIDLVVDKFSQMPLFYKAIEGKNLEKLYIKMMNQQTDYAIFESGRKVGVESTHPLYNSDATFNNDKFDNIVQVSWKTYGIQQETSSEAADGTMKATQATKIVSVDLFENGIPINNVVDKAYKRNVNALNMMQENAYRELLDELGIVDLGDGFTMVSGEMVSNLLVAEMLRRKMSDNAKDSIQLDDNGEFRIPFEASPSYSQIRNIIYSVIDKALVRQKVNGGGYIMAPATLWEDSSKGRGLAIKEGKQWRNITIGEYNKLTDEQKKKVALTSSDLKFYTKEQPWIEILVPSWFRDKFDKKRFPNDASILKYLNTKEGKQILKGVGFRIPTQARASMDVFVVKGFLPDYMGATVVVPSEIVSKQGADFDVDKLNLYLKNVYVDEHENVRLVKYIESEEKTKAFYANVFEERWNNKIAKIVKNDRFRAQLYKIFKSIDSIAPFSEEGLLSILSEEDVDFYYNYKELLQKIIDQAYNENMLASEYMFSQIEALGEIKESFYKKLLNSEVKDRFVRKMYTGALENEYFDSLIEMLSLPEVFNSLISPIGNAGLDKLAEELVGLRGTGISKKSMIDRNFLAKQRHYILRTKANVGIVAVNITNHSVLQKASVHFDPSTLDGISKFDKKIIGNGHIVLPHNKVMIDGKEVVSMSGIKTADGKELISQRLSGYGTAFVDGVNDPYIIDIVQSDRLVGLILFLERIGAGETAAYFLAQPIIYKYMQLLDGVDVRGGLFSKFNVLSIFDSFPAKISDIEDARIDVSKFKGNIKKYYTKGEKLSSLENAEQQKILIEFLKYAKMSEYSFKYTQAIKYDTTNYRNGDVLFNIKTKTERVAEKNIWSSINDVLNNTFMKEQIEKLDLAMDAVGEILKLEQAQFRAITNPVLLRHASGEYVSQKDKERISDKIKSSFFDYVVQIKGGINNEIEALTTGEQSVAVKLEKAKMDFPTNEILKNLDIESSNRQGGPSTIKLIANPRTPESDNLYTGMMRDLRDALETRDLYYDIVVLSIIQGTYQSNVSIKNIIPIEDYSDIISQIIFNLSADVEIESFETNNAFERNNWKDAAVFSTMAPIFFINNFGKAPPVTIKNDIEIFQHNSPNFPTVATGKFSVLSSERKILLVSETFNRSLTEKDFIKIPRIVVRNMQMIDMKTGRNITKADFIQRKKKGDLSLTDTYGYARVKDGAGFPLITTKINKKGEEEIIHIYKLINLLGDGKLVSEYYVDGRPSVLNNGTVKTDEIEDVDIVEYYEGRAPRIPSMNIEVTGPELGRLQKGTKKILLRSQAYADKIGIPVGETEIKIIAGKKYNVTNKGLSSVDDIGGKETTLSLEGITEAEASDLYKEFLNNKIKLYVFDLSPITPEITINEVTPTQLITGGKITPEIIHNAADNKGIDWDDDVDFMDKSEELTGKRELSKMSSEELNKILDWINSTITPSQKEQIKQLKELDPVVDKPTQPSTSVKEGVSELFESNPDLANQVYEAIGFVKNLNKLKVQDMKTKVSEKFSNLEDTRKELKEEITSDKSLSELEKNLLTKAIDGMFDIPGSNPFIIDDINGYTSYNLKKFEEFIKYEFPNLDKKQITAILSKHVEHFAVQHKAALLSELEGESGLPNNMADLELSKITPQQKQQAQQQYSQYLDTIFPDSKVKDIVYHGSSQFGFDTFSKEKLGEFTGSGSAKLGFFFSNSLENSFSAYTRNIDKDVSFSDDGGIEGVDGTFGLSQLDSMIEDLETGKNFTDNEIRNKEYYVKSTSESGGTSFGIPFKSKEEALENYKNDDWSYNSKNKFEVIEDLVYGKYNYKKVDWLKDKPVIYYRKELGKTKEDIITEKEYNDALTKRKNFLLSEREKLIKNDSKTRVYNILLNSKTLKEFDDNGNKWREETYVDRIKQTLDENKDGLVIKNTYDPLLNDVYVVFDPEQIHILGSKQDIEGFKEFVKQPINKEIKPNEVRTTTQPSTSVKEKTYTFRQLASMNAKNLYKQLGMMEVAMDAEGLAYEYFANGGKISPETLYNEVLTRRDSRLVPTKSQTIQEVTSRDFVKAGERSIKEVAHDIWDELPEEIKERVSDQDIRNELIEVAREFNKRMDIAKSYIDMYGPSTKELGMNTDITGDDFKCLK